MKNKFLNIKFTSVRFIAILLIVFVGLGFIYAVNVEAAAKVTIKSPLQANYGQIIEVPINISSSTVPIAGFTITGVVFDNTKLSYVDYIGDTSPGTNLVVNQIAGKVNINQFGKVFSGANNDLVRLKFRVISPESTDTTLSFNTGDKSILEVSNEMGDVVQTIYTGASISLNKGSGTSTPPTASSTLPQAPTQVVAFAGNTFASVQFRPATTTGTSTIVRYTVTSSPGGITSFGVTSPILVTGLTNGTSYTFTVTATDMSGRTSAPSAASNVVRSTAGNTMPGAPTNLSVSPGNARVILNWTAPANLEETPFGVINSASVWRSIFSVFKSSPRLTDYIIEYRTVGATSTWIRYNDGVSINTTAVVSGLQNGQTYEFTVSAEVNGVVGTASNVARATPRDPNVRPIISVNANPNPIVSGSHSMISWTASNVTTCNVSKAGSSTPMIVGSSTGAVSTGPLVSSTMFIVSCVGLEGVTGTAGITVNVAMPASGGGTRAVPILVPDIEEEDVKPVPVKAIEAPMSEMLYYKNLNTISLTASVINSILGNIFGQDQLICK